MVPNIDGTMGHKIKTIKDCRHGTQYVIQYSTNRNPAQSLEENAIPVFVNSYISFVYEININFINLKIKMHLY